MSFLASVPKTVGKMSYLCFWFLRWTVPLIITRCGRTTLFKCNQVWDSFQGFFSLQQTFPKGGFCYCYQEETVCFMGFKMVILKFGRQTQLTDLFLTWHQYKPVHVCLCTFSVRAGVDHFKNGRHVEAMNEYNKALDIDTNNVEALVARGALWVSSHF